MSRRALIVYFGSLAVLLLILALVAFRPTPLTGFDGDDLAKSVNNVLTPGSIGTCKREGEAWKCPVWNDSVSGTITYAVTDPDWWGCWDAEHAKGPPMGPKTLSGCITILDHT